jgi:hypothetical protein
MQTDRQRDPHTELEETWEMKFPQLPYYRERDTQRRKAANFIFIYLFFCGENPSKSPPPMKTYMVKGTFWKISKKKKEIATFSGGKQKKRVLK